MGANLILPSSSPADDAEVVTKSCRFDGTTAYMSRTFGTPTDLDKWTWACWVKRAEMDTIQVLFGSKNISGAPLGGGLYFNANNTLTFYDSGSSANFTTSAVYRDYSAWYHLAVTLDIAGGDATLYVNGEEAGTGSVSGSSSINSGGEVHHIAREVSVTGYFAGVYLADMYFVDGAIVTPNTNFIETDGTTGQLKPKAYTVSGTNGFHLDFKDSADLGNDAAGSNDFAESGLAASDQMNDRPTNNYATLNPLAGGTTSTFTEGNLVGTCPTTNGAVMSTIALPSTGKWYCEFEFDSVTTYATVGVGRMGMKGWNATQEAAAECAILLGQASDPPEYGVIGSDFTEGTTTGTPTAIAADTVYGLMWDADASDKTLKVTDGTTTTSCTYTTTPSYDIGFIFATSSTSLTGTVRVNFGQDPTLSGSVSGGAGSEFYLTKPEGYSALSTANLPTPTIAKGHEYFNTLLYDDGTGAKTFGAADNLSPDLVWVKSRGSSNNHKLTDSLRGVQKSMESDTVDAEVTESSNVGVTVFGADGFTIGSSSSTAGPYADQTGTGTGMVGWGWKQDSTPGFKIVEWTGDTNTSQEIDTSGTPALGAAPDFGIFKSLASANWYVYHKSLTALNYLTLDTPDSQTGYDGDLWTVGEWDSDSIKVGDDSYGLYLNTNTQDYVAYLFSEVSGFSKFGIYTANQAVDGPFVWLGFRPAFLMIKERSSSYENWTMLDSKRSTFNLADDYIYGDTDGSEGDGYNGVDFLSNGFKVRTGGDSINYGTDYIFAAFAEQPFKYAAAR